MDNRPIIEVKLNGEEGNIYFIIGVARKALEDAGQKENADKLFKEVDGNAHNYWEALQIINKYVQILLI